MDTAVQLYKKIIKGELKRFPDRFWVDPGADEHARQITKYFIEEILNWNEEEVKNNLTEMIFRKNKLSGMLEYVFNRSPFKALENAYPNRYKEWEFKHVPRNLWEDEDKRNEALKWLLEKTKKDKFEELTNADFINNGLSGLMDYLHKKKAFKDVDRNKVEDNLKFKERILKVTFNKSGGNSSRNSVTTRLTLPTSWVKHLGITEDNREVIVKLEDEKIIIEKVK